MKRLLLSALFLATASSGAASDLVINEISCGDHWLTIHAEIDPTTRTARVWYTGDGVDDTTVIDATVTEVGSDVSINFQDGSNSSLVIDTFDSMHDLYWGALVQNGQTQQLGLCSVQ